MIQECDFIMDSIHSELHHFLPLEGTEQAFKYIFEHGLSFSEVDTNAPQITQFFQGSDSYSSYGGFQEIVRSMRDNEPLPDSHFFRPGENIAIMRHPRYMPEILHTHQNFFEIQYVLSGEISQIIGGVPITLRSGDICFVAPNALHSPSIADDDTIMINILIRVETLRNAFSRSYSAEDIISAFCMRIIYGKTFQPMLVCHTGVNSASYRLVMDMVEQSKIESPYTDKLLCAMMEILFIYLLRDHKDGFTAGKPLRKNDTNVLHIMRYAQDHYAEISLHSLAKQFSYSETYLSQLIKSYYGRTFQEIMTEYRLQNAARLLSISDATISEIIETVGYKEKSHFFRAFKRKYGMTPSVYKSMAKASTSH